jgi:hypothetical protein
MGVILDSFSLSDWSRGEAAGFKTSLALGLMKEDRCPVCRVKMDANDPIANIWGG